MSHLIAIWLMATCFAGIIFWILVIGGSKKADPE